MVIGEGIGQLKWVYFEQRPHRLADFDTFDGGSRGPLGAIKMLYKINGRAIVASIGGIVTILALAMDPFVQQVVSFESKPRNNPEVPSLISTARSYDHSVLGAPSNFAMPTYPVILGRERGSIHTTFLSQTNKSRFCRRCRDHWGHICRYFLQGIERRYFQMLFW